MDLVREFATNGSDPAFATLVQRHVNLVYSAALRRLDNSHDAEEVTQAVFVILAKKAGNLRQETILSGWLYQTAQLTSANFQRADRRRLHREQEAFMELTEKAEPDASWQRLGPLLEEAMTRLGRRERDAVVLRFFKNLTVREVAAALGLQEAAAQKRVNRATDKLRKYFLRHGVQVSSVALLASIGTHAVQAAPVELAAKVATAAALKGAAGSGTLLPLVNTTLKLMAWTKAKTAVVGAIVLLAAGTATVTVERANSLFGNSQRVNGQSFTCSGNFYHTNYDVREVADSVINATFTTTVKDHKVYMRLNFAPDYYAEWSYDGLTSYDLIDSPDRVNLVKGARAAVSIRENEFPATADCFFRTIWLGLCSAHYFQYSNTNRNGLLVPWGDRSFAGLLSFQWKEQNLSAPPYLPSNIVFIASSALWPEEQKQRINQRQTFPFDDGFVGGQFQVSQCQIYDEMTIPSAFTLKRYRAGEGSGKLLEYYRVEVTNISAAGSEGFVPKIHRPTDVSDMRDESPEMPLFGITYTLTNDAWLAKSDPQRLALINAQKPVYWKWRSANARRDLFQGLLQLQITTNYISR